MSDLVFEIKTVLARVLANGTTADDIGTSADLVEEYALDSLQMISFLLGIEDALNVELDYENLELRDLRSVAQFAAHVGRLTTAAAS
jgi:acyl carrier protein